MLRKRVSCLLVLIVTLSFLASCASQKELPETATQEQKPAPGMDKPVSGWEEEWNKTLQAARREGKVSIYGTVGADTRDALIKGFRERYGLGIDYISGRGGELSQKLLTERRAGLFLMDVYAGGATTLVNELKPAGILEPVLPALILPEVKEGSNWWGGVLPWLDKDQKIFAFTAYPTVDLAANTDLVREGEIKSWKDLLNPKWREKIIMNDPTGAGAGLGWFARTTEMFGVDYMKQLAENRPAILRDERLQVEWLARGRYALLLNPKSEMMSEFIKAGAPVKYADIVEGVVSTGSGHVALVSRAPHPFAAKVFTNWLLSREGQTIYSKSILQQSAREDIPVDHLDRVRKPGLTYYMDKEETLLKRPAYAKLAQEIFGTLMK